MTLPVKAKEAVAEIVETAKKRDLKRRLSQIYTILGTYSYVVEENYPKGIKYLEDALRIAQEVGDLVSLWMASHWIGHAFAESCKFETALYHLENALKISVAGNVLWTTSIMKSCIARTVYDAQGKVTLSYETSKEGVQMAEDSGDIFSMAEAYTNHGCSCYTKGFLDEAEKCLLRGKAFCDRIGYSVESALASSRLGLTYLDKGEYKKSKKCLSDANSLLEHCNLYPSAVKANKIFLARSKVMNKETDIDIEVLCRYVNENKVKEYDGSMKRAIGELLSNIDDQHISEAEQWMVKAIETDRKNGTVWNLGRDYAAYAELFKRKGNPSKAKENFARAIDIFKECGADGWVQKYEEEMASLV
jgi:tetratricopeptide (TPR) repeat protein